MPWLRGLCCCGPQPRGCVCTRHTRGGKGAPPIRSQATGASTTPKRVGIAEGRTHIARGATTSAGRQRYGQHNRRARRGLGTRQAPHTPFNSSARRRHRRRRQWHTHHRARRHHIAQPHHQLCPDRSNSSLGGCSGSYDGRHDGSCRARLSGRFSGSCSWDCSSCTGGWRANVVQQQLSPPSPQY